MVTADFRSSRFPVNSSRTTTIFILFYLGIFLATCLPEIAAAQPIGMMSFQRYAILIGVNAYPDRPLKGCVRDVQSIKAYLEGLSDGIHIVMFTATESADPKLPSPVEDPTLRPTYQNITSALEKITRLANAGDFVYIHFSGHGTRAEPSSEFSSKSTGDLALVLLDEETSVRYLRGPRLAISLKAMVDKGLVVTLVLDCCFAASVYRRDDPTIRFLPYNPDAGSQSPPGSESSLDHDAVGLVSRDASTRLNWFIDPDGWAILAACDPHQEAAEPEFDGEKHGALSYFLLQALMECGSLNRRHRDIYSNLRARFRHSVPQQNPVFRGNEAQGFFGYPDLETITSAVPVSKKEDGGLEVLGGQAHGICKGDQFALYPFSSGDSGLMEDQILAKVTQVSAFSSDVEQLETTSASARAQTGWVARPLTQLLLQSFPIRLPPDLACQDEWLMALSKRSLTIHDDADRHSLAFQVVLNNSKEFEILDGSGEKLTNLPLMLLDQMDVDDICDILQHLTRFKLVSSLTNKTPSDAFQESFTVQISSRTGAIINPGSLLEVEHSEKKFTFELLVENRARKSLYVYVYDMGPCWQIQNIDCGTYEVVPQEDSRRNLSGTMSKKLCTVVPREMREKGHHSCDDTIKVFVTSQPTSFGLLELPKLGDPAQKKVTTRTGRNPSASDDWVALDFRIRTSLSRPQ